MKTKLLANTNYASLVFAILCACVLALWAGRTPADDLDTSKASIRYNDLNLATAQGAKALYARIEKASYEVCRHYDRDERDNADPLSLQACRRKVIADAVRKVGKPTLYAEYNARNAVHLPTQIVTAEIVR